MKKRIEEKLLKMISVFLIFLIISSIFTVYLLNPVYAYNYDNEVKTYSYSEEFTTYQQAPNNSASSGNVCCQKTKQNSPFKGENCVYTSADNCDLSAGQPSGTTCEQTNYCKVNVCILTSGQCRPNVLKGVCLSQGGTPKEGTVENNPICQKGCCSLPTGSFFVEQAVCANAIKNYESLRIDVVFDSSLNTEETCLAKSRSLETGCCVLPNICSFTTRADCVDKSGDFKSNTLCSYPELGCRVTEKHHTGCFEGKVYWFDSANNPEDIYGTQYKTNGQRVPFGESCNPNSGNIESLSCGNCDFSRGSICDAIPEDKLKSVSDKKLKYWCADLSCKNVEKSNVNVFWQSDLAGRSERANGEFWCEYEGATGEGNDLVGSRHYARGCINGKEIVQTCAEERRDKGVCVQGKIPKYKTGLNFDFTSAKCQDNNADECLSLNSQYTKDSSEICTLSDEEKISAIQSCGGECADFDGVDKEKCCNAQLCRKKACGETKFGKCFWNDAAKLCSPAVPIGDRTLKGDRCKQNFGANGIVQCKEVWYNGFFSTDYDKKSNANCRDPKYIEGLQNFCRSLGDCGFNYNVIGKEGNGFSASGPDHNLDNQLRPIIDVIRTMPKYPFINRIEKPLNGSLFFEKYYNAAVAFTATPQDKKDYTSETAVDAIMYSNIAIGVAYSSFVTYTAIAGTANLWNPLGWVLVAVSAISIIIKSLWGKFTDLKTVTYEFTCGTWQPPAGGNDCEKCNDFTICDEYKCNSLGKSCGLINKGLIGNESCVAVDVADVNPAVITPLAIPSKTLNDFIYPSSLGSFSGYEFKQELDPFSDVNIGVNTDKFAECRISNKPESSFDQMKPFRDIGDNVVDKKQHKMTVKPAFVPQPQPGSETQIQIVEDQILAYAGRDNIYYVKCESVNGNVNPIPFFIKFKVKSGPDLQPPKIEGFSILDGSYIQYNATQTDIVVYTNEPLYTEPATKFGGCKFSKTDQEYSKMEFSGAYIGIANNQHSTTAKLTGLKDNQDNIFYFRCKDRAGNENTESTKLTLKGTKPLKIISGGPSGLVYATEVELNLETSEGAENGKANCYYSQKEFFDVAKTQFDKTNDVKHNTKITLQSGNYNIYTWCRDIAGNFDKRKLEFQVNTGITPSIVKVYITSGNVLNIKTDEKASCKYKNDKKDFNFDTEGIEMTTSDKVIHSQVIGDSKVFNVMCKHESTGKISKVLSIYPGNI